MLKEFDPFFTLWSKKKKKGKRKMIPKRKKSFIKLDNASEMRNLNSQKTVTSITTQSTHKLKYNKR